MAAVEALSYGIKGVFLAGDLLSYEELWNNVSFRGVMYYNPHNVTDYYTGQKLTMMVELGAPLSILMKCKASPCLWAASEWDQLSKTWRMILKSEFALPVSSLSVLRVVEVSNFQAVYWWWCPMSCLTHVGVQTTQPLYWVAWLSRQCSLIINSVRGVSLIGTAVRTQSTIHSPQSMLHFDPHVC